MRLAADFNDRVVAGCVGGRNPQTTFYTSGKYNYGVSIVDTIPGGAEFPASGTTYALSLNKIPDIIAKVAVDGEDMQGHSTPRAGYGLYQLPPASATAASSTANPVPGGGVHGDGAIFGLVPSRGCGRAGAPASWAAASRRYGSGQLTDVSFGLDGTIKPIQEWELMLGIVHPTKTLDVYAYAGEEREMQQQYGTRPPRSETPASATPSSTMPAAKSTLGPAVTAPTSSRSPRLLAAAVRRQFGRVQWGIQYSYSESATVPGFPAQSTPRS